MIKRYFVALVEDFVDGGYFVANSRHNRMFFENWNKGRNTKFYDVIFKIIVVDENDIESVISYLEPACGFDDEDKIREKAKEAWFMFDFNFKHCTEEEKKQMILDYDVK